MEKYEVKNHLFYDGYDLKEEDLKNPDFIEKFMKMVDEKIFDNKGKITIIPYFNGKVKEDGGVSGIILGDNFHFTCHGFCYKNTVFIDYFGDDSKKEELCKMIFDYFKTDNYDLGSKDVKGNFGKHIIIYPEVINVTMALAKVKQILKEIVMTPIMDSLVNEIDDNNFDVLQPIAESHISFHQHNNNLIVDAFSCKYFDVDKFLSLFNCEEYIEVNRGIKYK